MGWRLFGTNINEEPSKKTKEKKPEQQKRATNPANEHEQQFSVDLKLKTDQVVQVCIVLLSDTVIHPQQFLVREKTWQTWNLWRPSHNLETCGWATKWPENGPFSVIDM